MNLPSSFSLNTCDRMIQFLDESNRIENITETDYQDANLQKVGQGHFGALVDSQQMAIHRQLLTVKKIKDWQSLLTREQQAFGHHIEEDAIGHIRSDSLQKNVRIGRHIPPHYDSVPTLLSHLVEKINEELKNQQKLLDDLEYCHFLGRSFQEFESIHPFVDGNGRVGRLIVNYIATFCNRPIIVFKSEMIERNRYYDAHASKIAMARFMAKKVQEVIFGIDGKILFRKEGNQSSTAKYESLDLEQNELYEWHSIFHLLNPEVAIELEKSSANS